MKTPINAPLSELEIIGVKHRGATPVAGEQKALGAYASRNVYMSAAVPYHYTEIQDANYREDDSQALKMGKLGGTIADIAAKGFAAGRQILMTGGNCNHATGVLGGMQMAYGADARIGLVWFDAHGDFNTPRTTITGSLGGMPVAVCAGLAYPEWREASGVSAPIPTDRIVLSDMRNLDPEEKRLIDATDAVIAAMIPGQAGEDLAISVRRLSEKVDQIYLHIDADILDAAYVPHHGTIEPNGPNMEQVLEAARMVFESGKVTALALVSVYFGGEAERDIESGAELLEGLLSLWSTYGSALTPPNLNPADVRSRIQRR